MHVIENYQDLVLHKRNFNLNVTLIIQDHIKRTLANYIIDVITPRANAKPCLIMDPGRSILIYIEIM